MSSLLYSMSRTDFNAWQLEGHLAATCPLPTLLASLTSHSGRSVTNSQVDNHRKFHTGTKRGPIRCALLLTGSVLPLLPPSGPARPGSSGCTDNIPVFCTILNFCPYLVANKNCDENDKNGRKNPPRIGPVSRETQKPAADRQTDTHT